MPESLWLTMRLYYRFMRAGCHAVFVTLFGGRAYGLHHLPATGGVVLVCNHQSFLDPMLAGLAVRRECHYMARDSLFRNPWFARLIRSVNAFSVRRGTADVGAMKETMRLLKSGEPVLAFPEATRSRDGTIAPFHAGMAVIARRLGVPMVPVMITGAYECWPRDRALPRLGRIIVEYGPRVTVEQIAVWAPEQIMAELRRRVVAMYDRRRPQISRWQRPIDSREHARC